jgi:peroxiredoxin-like protein
MENESKYQVQGFWKGGRNGLISAEGVVEPTISFSAPAEFKGESGHWTPEHFLVAAVGSCFVVTFAAIPEASKLKFLSLEVSVEGKLRKVNGRLGFAEVVVRPTLTVIVNEDYELGDRLLEKAEQGCLMARTLACPVRLEALVQSAEEVLAR